VTGDVVGPAGATLNAVARFDASGKVIKNSLVTISDSGLVSGVDFMAFASNNVRLAGVNNLVGPSNPSGSVANVCVGNGAGQSLTSGGTNVCVGDVAGPNVGAGNGNVFIGQLASVGMTSGDGNVFVGDNTPSFAANASNNVIVGARSKAGGSNSIALGADVETGLGVPTNHACIGNNSVVALYNQGDGSCDLGRATNRFKDLHLGGVAKLSGYTASAGKLFTVNASGDLIQLPLTGPGTLQIDAAGTVSVGGSGGVPILIRYAATNVPIASPTNDSFIHTFATTVGDPTGYALTNDPVDLYLNKGKYHVQAIASGYETGWSRLLLFVEGNPLEGMASQFPVGGGYKHIFGDWYFENTVGGWWAVQLRQFTELASPAGISGPGTIFGSHRFCTLVVRKTG
jgi:hypothetical protein